jgi:hypothetical protein
MKNPNQNQTPTLYKWDERLKKYVYDGDAQRSKRKGNPDHGVTDTPKNPTGYGVRSSGKRKRCALKSCQAFASPSGSGLCSAHEQKFTPVGQKVANAMKFKCKTRTCENPQQRDVEYCKDCCARKLEHAKDLDYVNWDLEDGLGDVDEL